MKLVRYDRARLLTSVSPSLQCKAHTRHFSQVACVAGPVACAPGQGSVDSEQTMRQLPGKLAVLLTMMLHLLDTWLDRGLLLRFLCSGAFPGHTLVRRSQVA